MRFGRREVALAVAVGVFVLVIALIARARMQTESAPVADWCSPGLEPLGNACFASAPDPKGLIVYLHGRYTPETQNEENDRQVRVARMATSRGFSVIAFRGKQGACLGPELASNWCWPSNERTQDAGPEAVAGWSAALEAAEARTGPVPHYLLGFSNGAYFADLITTRALLPFDAVAIVSGGPVEPTKALGPKPPILLVTADDDGAQDEVLRLESELRREGWPNALASREGGHALTDFDIDMALTFFKRTQTEKLPFSPPLSTRRPIRNPDAGRIDMQTPPPVTTPDEDDD